MFSKADVKPLKNDLKATCNIHKKCVAISLQFLLQCLMYNSKQVPNMMDRYKIYNKNSPSNKFDFFQLKLDVIMFFLIIWIICNILQIHFKIRMCQKETNKCPNKCCIGKEKETWTDLNTGNKLSHVVVTNPK